MLMNRDRAVSVILLAVGSSFPTACADEFDSCEDTATCEPEPAAAGAGGAAGPGDAGGAGGEPGSEDPIAGEGGGGSSDPGPVGGDECAKEGATSCESADDAALLTCTDGAWERSACGAGFVCASDPTACTPVAEGCEARRGGDGFCVDEVLHVCAPDRTTVTERACEGICFVDECLPVGCGDGVVAHEEACDDGNEAAGDGCSRCRWEPVGVKAIAHHSCAWFADGSLKCWGRNDAGQLGLGHTEDPGGSIKDWSGLSEVALRDVTDVAGSMHSTCAIAGGEIYCWGGNSVGELARGNTTGELRPVKVPFSTPRTFVRIEASLDGTYCAISSRPTEPLLCWGKNDVGQAGRGMGPASVAARQNIGDTAGELLLLPSGPEISNSMSVTLGFNFGCAVSNGILRCWGAESGWGVVSSTDAFGDEAGETLPPIIDLGNDFVTAEVVAGRGRGNGCVRSEGGHVKCSHAVADLATEPIIELGDAAFQVASGRFFACALVEGGEVECWGTAQASSAIVGELDISVVDPVVVPLSLQAPATNISAGLNHICALLETGTIECVGDNQHGQLGNTERDAVRQCPRYAIDRVRDPSHSLLGTCCTTVSGSAGALVALPRAAGYLGCKAGSPPTRE